MYNDFVPICLAQKYPLVPLPVWSKNKDFGQNVK